VGVVAAKLAVALLVRGPQGVRRRVRVMQRVMDGVQAVLDRCVEAEADEKAKAQGQGSVGEGGVSAGQ
jgi:hypothetical protein